MAGVRTATGRGRQVQDISFHLTQLRKRVGEISSEIRRMHQEHGQLQKDTSTHDTLQRRYDDCIKDVCSAMCANAGDSQRNRFTGTKP